jgi:L-cysteine desulfidase
MDHSHINPLNCAGSACTAVGGEVAPAEKTTLDYKLSVKEILQFAQEATFENIEFILDSVKLNKALADAGLRDDYGLKVGKTILAREHSSVFGSSIMTYAMAATAAASDARMAGCTLPAMSNSGSGNQGITVTMPVIAVAEKMGVSQEQLARALVLSHLVAIHIKGYLGKLSALCGCVIASTGSSCGIVYLNGGSYEQVCAAIKNMVGNITGMVCDGAKVGCALKVASGVSSSIQAAVLALDNICISSNDGIIEDCIEKTICNLGRIGAEGMQTTDKMILDIMVCK